MVVSSSARLVVGLLSQGASFAAEEAVPNATAIIQEQLQLLGNEIPIDPAEACSAVNASTSLGKVRCIVTTQVRGAEFYDSEKLDNSAVKHIVNVNKGRDTKRCVTEPRRWCADRAVLGAATGTRTSWWHSKSFQAW
eukprot:gnl/MRDRNA2_/MRDRNA2_81327_c0_seq2.p1 gnl/MRDRNA2_/MRDRNA2_81327_c0~~gnl/MRDRNA2_/MRDRNA2_81327_c0_seq2.p1  ORF type:complete len:137 (-),score=15.83 gnl/MRDRNA2_/MRDRNA2_81327_c0_seq2:290-700(-)